MQTQAPTAAQPSVAVTADGRKLRPLTDMEIAQDAYSKGDFPKALDHFRAAAVAGDADAMYYTGVMYAEAQGLAKADMKEAIRWYEKAAARDQPKALADHGAAACHGVWGGAGSKKALEMFERAVKASPPGEEHNQAEGAAGGAGGGAGFAVEDGVPPSLRRSLESPQSPGG